MYIEVWKHENPHQFLTSLRWVKWARTFVIESWVTPLTTLFLHHCYFRFYTFITWWVRSLCTKYALAKDLSSICCKSETQVPSYITTSCSVSTNVINQFENVAALSKHACYISKLQYLCQVVRLLLNSPGKNFKICESVLTPLRWITTLGTVGGF